MGRQLCWPTATLGSSGNLWTSQKRCYGFWNQRDSVGYALPPELSQTKSPWTKVSTLILIPSPGIWWILSFLCNQELEGLVVENPLMRYSWSRTCLSLCSGSNRFTTKLQVVAEMAADLSSKLPSVLTDADAAAITFQVDSNSKVNNTALSARNLQPKFKLISWSNRGM